MFRSLLIGERSDRVKNVWVTGRVQQVVVHDRDDLIETNRAKEIGRLRRVVAQDSGRPRQILLYYTYNLFDFNEK